MPFATIKEVLLYENDFENLRERLSAMTDELNRLEANINSTVEALAETQQFYEDELKKQDAHIEFLEKELYGDKTKKIKKRKK